MSIEPRMNRLFSPDGKCFSVAVDHGFFGVQSLIEGIEDMPKVIDTLVNANPDALLLSPGSGRILQRVPGRHKPMFFMRVDVANLYNNPPPEAMFDRLLESPLEQAIQLDAVCVVANLFMIPGKPDAWNQSAHNVMRLKPLCERYGVPLMVEALSLDLDGSVDAYNSAGDLGRILTVTRQAVELGADIIKGDTISNMDEYYKVVEIAGGIPVMARGGGRVDDEEILRRTYSLMQQGVVGVIYGRNIIYHADPAGMTKAMMAIIHDGATPEEAIKHIGI